MEAELFSSFLLHEAMFEAFQWIQYHQIYWEIDDVVVSFCGESWVVKVYYHKFEEE